MKRRDFIKVSGIAGGGFLMNLSLPLGELLANNNGALSPNAFLKIDNTGKVIFTLTKLEMGQGISTGAAMIIADELGADWDKFETERADYDSKRFSGDEQGGTGGSFSVRDLWNPLRKAGATAREMLVQAAANQWKVNQQDCYTKKGQVIHQPSGKKLDFAQLVTAAAKLPVPAKPLFKDSKDYQFIGKSMKNPVLNDLVVGKDEYGINLKLPGMLYASVERCPVYKGKLISYDASKALKIKGVKKVVAIKDVKDLKDGVAVIASSTWVALKARKALKINWDTGINSKASLAGFRKELESKHTKEVKPTFTRGNITQAFKEADTSIEATYENPYQCHATMEPPAAVAHFGGNKCDVWAGIQHGGKAQKWLASALGLSLATVKVHIQPAGGSFGRKFDPDFVIEAALISKLSNGVPIKLTWSREDDMQHDYFHHFQHSVHKAAIKDNKVTGWDFKVVKTVDKSSGMRDYDFVYHFPNIQTQGIGAENQGPVRLGAWRSVDVHSSALGQESFIDEIAHKIGENPLDFRMELLNHPVSLIGTGKRANHIKNYRQLMRDRYKVVLQEIRKKSDWGKQMPKGHGQGVAITKFGRTVCAQVAEVSVLNGVLKVNKVTAVMHAGRIINPHLVQGQVEGSIIWALSAVLYGGVDIKNGVPQATNFDTYPVLRMNETPQIDVHLIASEDTPVGVGEPATPPLAPAVLNAVFAATGKRIRKIPVLKDDLM